MPVNVGEVSSEVTVEGDGPASQATKGHPLPSDEELLRWRQTSRRMALDEARTRAWDFDD